MENITFPRWMRDVRRASRKAGIRYPGFHEMVYFVAQYNALKSPAWAARTFTVQG